MLMVTGGALTGWRMYEARRKRIHRSLLLHSTVESPLPNRSQMLFDLTTREVDVLIIGGGATGCGAALDATTRGLSVACIEQEDFGSGTSSKSTKLLWGGSRYLVQATVELLSPQFFHHPLKALEDFASSFKMVLACLHERNWLAEQQQHLVQWVSLAVPYDRWFLWPNPPFGFYPAIIGPAVGMFPFFFKLYDALGNFACPSSSLMSSATGKDCFPQVDAANGVKYFSIFYEAQHNDARTNIALALTAAMRGATMANYVKAESLQFDKVGKAIGVNCRDALTGEEYSIKAKNILCAGGPFTDSLRQLSGDEKIVTGAGGTHIVLSGQFCPPTMGYCNMQTSDGRFLFYLPWLGHTLVGTTDCETRSQELHTRPSEADITYLFGEMKKYLAPSIELKRSDVCSAWYGIRPLVDPGEGTSRDHYIEQNAVSRVWTIAGGKWTTYREMGEDVLDRICADNGWNLSSHSQDVLLIGEGPVPECSTGWHKNFGIELSQKYGLPDDCAEHLSRAYGTRAIELLDENNKDITRLHSQFPILEAEVRYAVKREFAQTAADIVCRRTRLAFLNVKACEEVLPRVCFIMGDVLGWDATRVMSEIESTTARLQEEFLGSC